MTDSKNTMHSTRTLTIRVPHSLYHASVEHAEKNHVALADWIRQAMIASLESDSDELLFKKIEKLVTREISRIEKKLSTQT